MELLTNLIVIMICNIYLYQIIMLYTLNLHILCISNKSVKLEIVTSFKNRDLPGGPVTKTSPSKAGDAGSTPDWGVKIPHASQPKKNKH